MPAKVIASTTAMIAAAIVPSEDAAAAAKHCAALAAPACELRPAAQSLSLLEVLQDALMVRHRLRTTSTAPPQHQHRAAHMPLSGRNDPRGLPDADVVGADSK